jgi:hypothetical protein
MFMFLRIYTAGVRPLYRLLVDRARSKENETLKGIDL